MRRFFAAGVRCQVATPRPAPRQAFYGPPVGVSRTEVVYAMRPPGGARRGAHMLYARTRLVCHAYPNQSVNVRYAYVSRCYAAQPRQKSLLTTVRCLPFRFTFYAGFLRNATTIRRTSFFHVKRCFEENAAVAAENGARRCGVVASATRAFKCPPYTSLPCPPVTPLCASFRYMKKSRDCLLVFQPFAEFVSRRDGGAGGDSHLL